MDTAASFSFEDLAEKDSFLLGPYRVDPAEMLAFSIKWDPAPVRVDDEQARARGLPGIAASRAYVMSVCQALLREAPWQDALLAADSIEQLRFVEPVHGGDELRLEVECRGLEAAADRAAGAARMSLVLSNQRGEPVMSAQETLLLARRDDAAAPVPAAALVPDDRALPMATALAAMRDSHLPREERIAYVAGQLDESVAGTVHADFEAGYAAGMNAALGMPPARQHEAGDAAFYAICRTLGTQAMDAMMAAEQAEKDRRRRRSKLITGAACAGVLLLGALFLL